MKNDDSKAASGANSDDPVQGGHLYPMDHWFREICQRLKLDYHETPQSGIGREITIGWIDEMAEIDRLVWDSLRNRHN